MSIWLAVLVIAGCVAGVVAAMLGLRRVSPAGGHFRDSDRASGVFGFVGAGFAILLGFVVLLTFEGYKDAKERAEDEASAVFDQYEVAALFQPPARRIALRSTLVCYARSVVAEEWPAMKSGHVSPVVSDWLDRLEGLLPQSGLMTKAETVGYQSWFEKAGERDDARRERLLESRGTLPALLWVMLILGAVAIVGFVLLYADPGERAFGQAFFAAGVTSVVVTSLLAVALLASPFQGGNGSVQPNGMRFTLRLIEDEAARLHERLTPPCDLNGLPT
jgi:amino acid transporter